MKSSATIRQMVKKIILLLLFTFPVIALGQQKEWTLQDCIQYALENNVSLKQQYLSVSLAEEEVFQSTSRFFPDLNLNGSHAYNFGRAVDKFTNEFETERVQTNNFTASSSVVLFNGFQNLNTYKQSRLNLQASQYDFQAMQNDISLAIASAYLQVLYSMELTDIASLQLEIIRQQVERTEKLVNAGTLAKGNLFTIQAQAAGEELVLVNAQNQLDLALLNLTQFLDLKNDSGFRIQKPIIDIPLETTILADPTEVYSIASTSQPMIKAAEYRVMSAEKGLHLAQGYRSPTLSFGASLGTGYSSASLEIADIQPGDPVLIGATLTGDEVYGPSYKTITQVKPFSNQLEDNFSQSLGFYLSIPVFNNFQVRKAVQQSKINLENSRLQQQIVHDQLYKTIQQAHADAKAALKKYLANQKNVMALEEAYRYMEQRFSVGMANSLDYNDAKNRLAQAQSETVQAKYDYIFRLKVLDFYMGKPINL